MQSEKDDDQTDAKNKVSPILEPTPPPQEPETEHVTETNESNAPIAEPFQSYQNDNKEGSSQDTIKETLKEDTCEREPSPPVQETTVTPVAEVPEDKKPR